MKQLASSFSRARARGKPSIVVLGGGFGGLEAALYLRSKLPDTADITLISDKDYFLFKPNTVYIPFGLEPGKLALHLAGPTRRRNISFVHAAAREIDPISKWIYFEGANKVGDIPYDFLVVATGAAMGSNSIPGLTEFGTTIWTTNELVRLRSAFQSLLTDAKDGHRRDVLFLVPPNNKDSGPLYEVVLMLDSWLRRKKVRDLVSITWTTFEETYLQAFGPGMHELASMEFDKRGITGCTHYIVDHVERDRAVYKNGSVLPFNLLVSFPAHGPSTHFTHLPLDHSGFIATDLRTRQVVGYPDIYAVGDAADFPIKLGDMAVLQADAAAESLAARLLGVEPAFRFGPPDAYLLQELDHSAFAQASLIGRAAGRTALGDLNRNPEGLHRLGSSPIWQLGRLALGTYLPWRFKSWNPFHEHVPWKGMELGLKISAATPTPPQPALAAHEAK